MSSILETFYILFKSNADEVDKGTKHAKDSTEKLDAALSSADKRTQQLGKGFVNVMAAAGGALAAIVSVGAAAAAISSTIKYTEELRLSSMAIGENIEDIDAWGRASKKFGGDSQTMQGTLKSLNTSIRETAFTGEGSLSPVLRRLGLNLRDLSGNIKTPLQLLPQIADAFQNISPAESLHLGQQLGLDQATILMLQKGRHEVEMMIAKQKSFGVTTKEDAELTKKFREQLSDTQNVFGGLARSMTSAVLPALTWFFEKLEKIGAFASRHKDLVSGLFVGVAAAISYFYVPAMIKAALATLAVTWPILAIIGAVALLVAAFAFAYDEVSNFLAGNNSLLGEAVKKWPVLGDIIHGIADGLKYLGSIDAFGKLAQFVQVLTWPLRLLFELFMNGVQGIADSIPKISAAIDNIGAMFTGLGDTIAGIFDGIIDFVKYLFNMPSMVIGKVQKMASGFGFGSDASQASNEDAIQKAQSAINLASTTPIASQSSSSINNTVMRGNRSAEVTVGSVIIETQATDADGISAAVGQSLTAQMRQAMYNFDDGVDA